MQITSGLGIYWSSLRHAQIGIDPRIAQCFTNLTKNELRFIEALVRPHSETETELLAAELEITASRYQQIIQLLTRLQAFQPHDLPQLQAPLLSEYHANWRINGYLPKNREHTIVQIPHLDWLGTEIALLLAAAGVQNLISADSHPVSTLSHPAFQPNYLGMRKNRALASYFRAMQSHTQHRRSNPQLPDSAPSTATSAVNTTTVNTDAMNSSARPSKQPSALAIVTGKNGIDPLEIDALLSQGICVLTVIAQEIDIIVGPLCTPSAGPCGMCLERHRSEREPNWPILAPQARVIRDLPLSLASAQLAASLALRAALEFIDAQDFLLQRNSPQLQSEKTLIQQNQLAARAWIVPPNPGFPVLTTIERHPDCLCALQQDTCQ